MSMANKQNALYTAVAILLNHIIRPSILVTLYDSKGVRLNTYGSSSQTLPTEIAAGAPAAAATPDLPAASTDSTSRKLIPVDVLLSSIAELNSTLTSNYQEESECLLLLQALLLLSSKQTIAPDYSNKRKHKLYGNNDTHHRTVATVTGIWQVL
jgi:hypothetical protein